MTDEERESKQGSIDIRKLPGYEVNIRLTSFIDPSRILRYGFYRFLCCTKSASLHR